MPTYVAFLRAINLGATRKFPKDAIRSATEAAGGTGVETYINTGNVRLTHSARSVAKVQAVLEEAYAAEAGFEACDVALQTHGGYGYAKEFYVERLWREVRLYKIAPVSQQMVLNHLSEHVLGLPKSY